tara:strand:+ start:335 stop:898 length:564 start_codon:yes stop_codon:yes gene_type:complete
MNEKVLHIDDALYECCWRESKALRAREGIADKVDPQPACAALYREARLLDQRFYEQWAELFTETAVYWVPAETEPANPRLEAGVHFDDKRRLLDRIALIRTGYLHAQQPPTRTARQVSNVEVWHRDDGDLDVISCVLIWAYRPGDLCTYAGRQEHVLAPSESGYLIRRKVIRLLDCDQPLGNITFML